MRDLRTKQERMDHIEVGKAAEARAYRYFQEHKGYAVCVAHNRYSPVDALVMAKDTHFAVDVKKVRMELFYQNGFHIRVDQVRKLCEAAELWRMVPLYFFIFTDGVGHWVPTNDSLDGLTVVERGPDPRQGGSHYRLTWTDVRVDPEWPKFWARKV